jgi:hypothetical protein
MPNVVIYCTLQCCRSGMFIPDPGSDFFPSRNCLHPGSRIRIKEFKYFNPKKTEKWFLSSRKYDPGCSSRIRIRMLTFYPSRIPDPVVKKAPDPGSATLVLWLWEGGRGGGGKPISFGVFAVDLSMLQGIPKCNACFEVHLILRKSRFSNFKINRRSWSAEK